VTAKRQLYDNKRDAADDIRDWVQVLLHDTKVKLPTLEQMSLPDLTSLSIAIDAAGAAWMSELVHDALTDEGET
jgi:hypothetical protein